VSFDQDDLPRIEFSENPLKMVVAQLRFPPEMGLKESDNQAAIQDALRDCYPIAMERQQEVEIQLQLVPGPTGAPQVAPAIVREGPMRFSDADGNWIASVGDSTLSLETKSYRTGEEFRERWSALVVAFQTILTPARVDRLGMRYINQLSLPGIRSVEDWSGFLKADLMGAIASSTLCSRVAQANDQVLLAVGSDGGSIRRFYSQNPEGVEPPSTMLLDFDLFSAEPFPFDYAEIMARLDRYHKWGWNLFRRSITDDLVSVLGVTQQ